MPKDYLMTVPQKITAMVYQNREVLRITRDDFRAYLETAVSDSGQPDLLEALKEAIDSLRYVNDALPETSGYGVRHERIEKGLSAINKAEGR